MAAKILVTGGTGLVGHGIQAALAEEGGPQNGEQWVFLGSSDCNLCDPASVDALFQREQPTHIIHLAAKVGGLFMNMERKAEMWSDNILMNENILRASQKFGVQKLVSCLSTCIFPDKTTYPISEDMLHAGPPHESNEGYAYAKRMLEVASRCYRDQYGSNFVTVIPTNIYGPHDNYHLVNSHVLPAFMHKCYLAKKSDQPFEVRGTGQALRQFLYSKDLGKLLLIVLRRYNQPTPIILSPAEEVTIGQVAETVAKAFDYNRIQYVEGADGQMRKTADNSKLLQFLKDEKIDFQFTPLEQGLKESIEWFVANYDSVRK